MESEKYHSNPKVSSPSQNTTSGQQRVRKPIVRLPKPEAYNESSKGVLDEKCPSPPADVHVKTEEHQSQDIPQESNSPSQAAMSHTEDSHRSPLGHFPVGYTEVRDSIFSLAQFKCIASLEDGSRCTTAIPEPRLQNAHPLPCPPGRIDIDRIIPFSLCPLHNTLNIRSGYARKWSDFYNLEPPQSFDGNQWSNKTFHFWSAGSSNPRSTLTPPIASFQAPKLKKIRSAQSILEKTETVLTSEGFQTNRLAAINLSVSVQLDSGHTTHPPVQNQPKIHRVRSVGGLPSMSSNSGTESIKYGEHQLKPENESRVEPGIGDTEGNKEHSVPPSDIEEPRSSRNSSEEPGTSSDTTITQGDTPKRATRRSYSRQVSDSAQKDELDRRIRNRIDVKFYVYVFTATVHLKPVIKIGITKNLKQRLEGFSKCDLDKTVVEYDSVRVPFLFQRRAEELAHLELSNFQWEGRCSCGKAHRELFTVDKDVAVKVVNRWVDFVQHAYDPQGTLRGHWSDSVEDFLKATPGPQSEEVQTRINGDLRRHHDIRHERYSRWIEETKRLDENKEA
jgi:T5orf172 domain-containing protein